MMRFQILEMKPSPFSLFQIHLVLLLIMAAAAAPSPSPPPCQTQCGNISIPFPFGIGQPHCFRPGFNLICNQSSTSRPELYLDLGYRFLKATAISLTQSQVMVRSEVRTLNCNSKDTYSGASQVQLRWTEFREGGPYTYSGTRNTFVTISCNTMSYVYSSAYTSLCASVCTSFAEVMRNNESCSGIGCCHTTIGTSPYWLEAKVVKVPTNTDPKVGPCTKFFLVDREWFNFNLTQLTDNNFYSAGFRVPVVLDWAIPWESSDNRSWTCTYAERNLTTYACLSKKSMCVESGTGYLCKCLDGFEGNPYTPNGCQDINECEINSCLHALCLNTIGNYSCYCPKGTHSWVDGQPKYGCSPDKSSISIGIVIGIGGGAGLGILLILAASIILYKRIKQINIKKQKENCFHHNHGLLLEQLLASMEDDVERTKIFSLEELEKATNNFDSTRIVGRGGHGTVYKGILADQRVVAVKKSEIADQSEIEQFINEVAILSQINHRNVVKLFGCCLEVEVPLLVYEFISGGTLSDHLHVVGNHVSSLSFEDRLRIAIEVASALSYLHSSASISIFHRDIKSANILLDQSFTAKVSDFGASRSIPTDKTRVTTMVQGTFGYLDPEYYHTGQLTEKSDVYGFGVILVELLTGEKAISLLRQEQNLSMHFIAALKEHRLTQILDVRVAEEGRMGELEAIAQLAERCLRLNGEERPTMKMVEEKLNRLSKTKKQINDQTSSKPQKVEETESLLGDILSGSSSNYATSSFSVEKEFMMSLKDPR